MKIKTSELSGAALDWMVWVCAGGAEAYPKLKGKAFLRAWRSNSSKYLNPSTEWAQGGPIVDRMRASGKFLMGAAVDETQVTFIQGAHIWSVYGPTPLVAACRCHVASKLGDEVEVPEELT